MNRRMEIIGGKVNSKFRIEIGENRQAGKLIKISNSRIDGRKF